jgi:hypothetical protein
MPVSAATRLWYSKMACRCPAKLRAGRGVGGEKFTPADDAVDRGGDVVVVCAGAQEADQIAGGGIARRNLCSSAMISISVMPAGRFSFREAVVLWNIGKEIFYPIDADDLSISSRSASVCGTNINGSSPRSKHRKRLSS